MRCFGQSKTEYPYSESLYEVVEQANRLLTNHMGKSCRTVLNYKDAFVIAIYAVDLFPLHSSAALEEKNEGFQLEAIFVWN